LVVGTVSCDAADPVFDVTQRIYKRSTLRLRTRNSSGLPALPSSCSNSDPPPAASTHRASPEGLTGRGKVGKPEFLVVGTVSCDAADPVFDVTQRLYKGSTLRLRTQKIPPAFPPFPLPVQPPTRSVACLARPGWRARPLAACPRGRQGCDNVSQRVAELMSRSRLGSARRIAPHIPFRWMSRSSRGRAGNSHKSRIHCRDLAQRGAAKKSHAAPVQRIRCPL
jgi:hypothetical protein